MGSACNNSASNNYFEKLTPDTGIVYTGPTITALSICTGDRLNEIEAVLLQKILNYATGVGISIPDINLSTCDAFKDCITCCNNGCKDLPCLLECYRNAICTIWGDVETLKTEIAALLDGPYDIGCLTSLGSNATLNEIIQALILQFCALKDQVTLLETKVATLTTGLPISIGNFLLKALTTCQGAGTLIKTGVGASAQVAFKGFVPIGAIIPYYNTDGSKFDYTGLGKPGTDVCGFALCNGNNGTVDMREQVPVGCGAGTMGGSTLPSNITVASNYGLGVLVGSANVLLTGPESGSAPHTHDVNDHGHDHVFVFRNEVGDLNKDKGPDNFMNAVGKPTHNTAAAAGGPLHAFQPGSIIPPYLLANVGGSVTGITINAATGSNATIAHENRQPSRALLYIQRIA